MTAVFSIFFWFYFALSSILLWAIGLVLFALTTPFDRNGRLLHLYSCLWAAHYLYLNPLWRVRVEGARAVDRERPFVIVANHQSFADILVLYATYLPFKWVSKSSVFKVPFLGWHMYANRYVSLTRGDKQSVEHMATACKRWLARGVSVLLFPEGTRSADGSLRPFKVGAFRIAREAGVPVLPIVVTGTANVLPKHGVAIRGRSECRVRVLAPMEVAGYASHEEAATAVHELMVRAHDELGRSHEK